MPTKLWKRCEQLEKENKLLKRALEERKIINSKITALLKRDVRLYDYYKKLEKEFEDKHYG